MANSSKPVRDPLLPLTHYQKLNKQQPKSKTAFALWTPIVILLVVAVSGIFLLNREIQALNQEANATPLPTIAEEQEPIMTPVQASPSAAVTQEGQFCGGIAAIQCGEGFTCQLDGTYPDAGGTCVSADKKAPTVRQPARSDLPVSSAPVSQAPAEAVMCTMDSMQCPDGSWVGRSGPQCEFKCPGQ
jgi:hypothetical protein